MGFLQITENLINEENVLSDDVRKEERLPKIEFSCWTIRGCEADLEDLRLMTARRFSDKCMATAPLCTSLLSRTRAIVN